jgi:hypothetical protein
MLNDTVRRMWPILLLAVAVGCGGGDDGGAGAGGADGRAGEARTVEVTTWIGSFQEAPLWAAAQDGGGEWQVVESADGVHSFEVTSGRYGFAFRCDEWRTYLFFSTVDEGEQVNRGCSGQYDENPTVRVAVEGLVEGELAWVGLGPSWSGRARPGAAAEVFPPPGVHDLVIAITDDMGLPRSVLVERDVEVREGEDLELTFDAADGVDTPVHSVGLEGYSHLTWVRMHLVTADGSLGLLGEQTLDIYGELDPIYGAHPGADPTDLYRIWIQESDMTGLPAGYRFISDPQDLALTAPEEFTLVEASAAATTPSVRLQATFEVRTGAAYSLLFRNAAGAFRELDVYLSAGWLADRAGTFTWQQPDFAGLDGWDSAAAFVDDVEVALAAVEMVGDLDPLIVLPQFPPDRKVPVSAELAGKAVTMAPATAMFVP